MGSQPRLGELLIADGVITPEQLVAGLERQVLQGGRIGTNLVEAFHIGMDLLASKLALQHQMPAATGAHFENADPEIQRRLDPALAHKFKAVPIGHISADTIAVACMDPLPPDAIQLIGDALGFKAIAAIAPELRVRYQLEKVYDVRRTARFLRVRSDPSTHPPPALPEVVERAPDPAEVARKKKLENKRRYVQTLSDLPALDIDMEPSGEHRTHQSLGRIALKKLGPAGGNAPAHVGVAENLGAEREPEKDTRSLKYNLRQIRRATGRDAVAEVVMTAMRDGIDEVIDAGILFINRQSVAIPWKGFIRDRGSDNIDRVVVPMAHASVLSDAFNSRMVVRRAVDEQHTEMDRRIWAVMQVDEPVEVIVLPMLLDEHIVGLVYAQSAQLGGLDSAAEHVLGELTKAMVRAFRRLMQAAQR